MKKTLLTGLVLVPSMMIAQTSLFADNFDSYTVGNTIAADGGPAWDTWGGGAGTAEDAFISDVQSSSASNSLNCYNTGAGAYLHDNVLIMPSLYTSGTYEYKMKIYVPSQSGGYFNLGGAWTTGGSGYQYGVDVFFNMDGTGHISTPSNGVFNYTMDAWTDVSVMIDLDNTTYDVIIDGTSAATGPWGAASGFGVADIFGIAYTDATAATETTSNFYIDDVEILDWTQGGVNLDEAELDINMDIYPNPNSGKFSVTLNNTDGENYTMTILDVLGNEISNESINASGTTSVDVDLELTSGMYFVNVSNANHTSTKRVIVR